MGRRNRLAICAHAQPNESMKNLDAALQTNEEIQEIQEIQFSEFLPTIGNNS